MSDFEDPDKTIIRPAAKLGTFLASALGGESDLALPAGTRLGEFQITRLVGIGSFGNVYLAQDYSLGRSVALKEYMPATLSMRVDGTAVAIRAPRNADAFAAGLISFVNEARLLARFDHPSLVKVHRFWEANGTAYMAMPFYDGPTLTQALADMNEAPNEQWLKDLLGPLLEALQMIHAQNCYHRDVAPDNIILPKRGKPVLLDFGATRHVIGDKSPGAVLRPGYAPVEQYARDATVRQGPWTDLYALAAVARYAITGVAPAPSVERIVEDSMEPLEKAAEGRYSERFLKGIDQALELAPEKRPQSAHEMRQLLGLGLGTEAESPEPAPVAEPLPMLPAGQPESRKRMWVGLACVGVAIAALGLFGALHDGNGVREAARVQEPAVTALPAPPAASEPGVTPGSVASAQAASVAAGPAVPASGSVSPTPATSMTAAAALADNPSAAASGPGRTALGATNAQPANAATRAAQGTDRKTGAMRPKAPISTNAAATETPAPARVEPEPPPQPAPLAQGAAPPVPPGASPNAGPSPLDSCSKARLFQSVCVRDRCKWPEFANHPVCVAARAGAKDGSVPAAQAR